MGSTITKNSFTWDISNRLSTMVAISSASIVPPPSLPNKCKQWMKYRKSLLELEIQLQETFQETLPGKACKQRMKKRKIFIRIGNSVAGNFSRDASRETYLKGFPGKLPVWNVEVFIIYLSNTLKIHFSLSSGVLILKYVSECIIGRVTSLWTGLSVGWPVGR